MLRTVDCTVMALMLMILGSGWMHYSLQGAFDPNFYNKTCPNVVQIIATVVNRDLK